MLVFKESGGGGWWGRNRGIRRNTSRSKGENQQQTQPTYPPMASTPGLESGPHWWEASALTTVPPLPPPPPSPPPPTTTVLTILVKRLSVLHMKCSMMWHLLYMLCMSCFLNDFHKNCSFIYESCASSSGQCFVFHTKVR